MARSAALALTLSFIGIAVVQAADRIPAAVMTTLTNRFPAAKIDKWTKEKEDGKDVYDIEFRQGERRFEADIFADGTILNWERQIPESDLPAAVVQSPDGKVLEGPGQEK